MNYDNSKQVILRKIVTDKPNAPVLSVQFEMAGEKFEAGLWLWTRKDGTPVLDKNGNQMYQGEWKIDTYTKEVNENGMAQARQAAAPPAPTGTGSFDEDIPFAQYEKGQFA